MIAIALANKRLLMNIFGSHIVIYRARVLITSKIGGILASPYTIMLGCATYLPNICSISCDVESSHLVIAWYNTSSGGIWALFNIPF